MRLTTFFAGVPGEVTLEIGAPVTGVRGRGDRTPGHRARVADLPNEAHGTENESTGTGTLHLHLTAETGTTENVTGRDIPSRNAPAPGEMHQRSQMSRYLVRVTEPMVLPALPSPANI